MTDKLKELLPCPFCGDTPSEVSFVLSDGGYKYGAIQCSCGVIGSDVRTGYKDFPHWRDAAVEQWNTRAPLPAVEAAEIEVAARDLFERMGCVADDEKCIQMLVSALSDGAGVNQQAGSGSSVQISGHLDEIDAPAWEFINAEARKLGPQTGSIDTYNFSRPNGSQPNGMVAALWNGSKLHALAVTVRDAHNRTVCARVLAAPLPPSPAAKAVPNE